MNIAERPTWRMQLKFKTLPHLSNLLVITVTALVCSYYGYLTNEDIATVTSLWSYAFLSGRLREGYYFVSLSRAVESIVMEA